LLDGDRRCDESTESPEFSAWLLSPWLRALVWPVLRGVELPVVRGVLASELGSSSQFSPKPVTGTGTTPITGIGALAKSRLTHVIEQLAADLTCSRSASPASGWRH